jgi:hypothetical protein
VGYGRQFGEGQEKVGSQNQVDLGPNSSFAVLVYVILDKLSSLRLENNG